MQKSCSQDKPELIHSASPRLGLPQNAENAEKHTLCSKNAEKLFLRCLQVYSMCSLSLGYLEMQKMQKNKPFAAKMRKSCSLARPELIHINSTSPRLGLPQNAETAEKTHPLQ